MKAHRFTLILSGIAELEAHVANTLFEATGGDIEFSMCNGVPYLEFSRQVVSLQDAITSAIRQVENAGVGVKVIRVESEGANIIAKINAELLGVASGKKRRPGMIVEALVGG